MLPSGLPEDIEDEEDLARFLVQRNQFSQIMVKPAVFLPNPKDKETSVSRHGSEPADVLWQLGRLAAGTRTLYGAAIVKARIVRKVGLDVTPAEPPPRHAVIRGWPWEADDQLDRKAERKLLAMEIASAASHPVLLLT